MMPVQPGIRPRQPGMRLEQPAMMPEQLGLGMRPEQPGLRPGQPGMMKGLVLIEEQPSSLTLRPAGTMAGQLIMRGQATGRMAGLNLYHGEDPQPFNLPNPARPTETQSRPQGGDQTTRMQNMVNQGSMGGQGGNMLVSQPGRMAQQANGHNEELRDDEAQSGLHRLLARQQELDARARQPWRLQDGRAGDNQVRYGNILRTLVDSSTVH